MMIEIAIYDDDAYQREILKRLVVDYAINHNLELHIQEFQSAQELLSTTDNYQILLLDIMLENNEFGIDVGQKLRDKGFDGVIILITSVAEYVFSGYTIEAFNYMLKPVNSIDFNDILGKAINKIKRDDKYISLLCNGVQRIFCVKDIVMVESCNRMRRIHTTTDTVDCRATLSEIKEKLPRGQFASPHNSFLVNLTFVCCVSATTVVMKNGIEVTVTRKMQESFMQALNDFVISEGGA